MTRLALSFFLTVLGVAIGASQQPPPPLRIMEPTAETVLVGHVGFKVAPVPRLKQVVYQVDGVEACRAVTPPFECSWDAGSRLTSRVVRAVATLEDGSRLTAAVRTKGMSLVSTTTVDVVLVPVRVVDDDGRFVKGLTADDFMVLDDQQPQKVIVIDAGEGGAEVLLALDVSKSMTLGIADLKRTVRSFLEALRPVDRVTLASFNTGLSIQAGRDTTLQEKLVALERLQPGGSTALYDTIIRAVETLRLQSGRRALVLFTDGEDMASQSSLEAARRSLQAHDVLLYLIATGKAASEASLRKQLRELAAETGGAAFFSGRLSESAEHFHEIVQDLAQQYLLSFSPTRPLGDGNWRTLTVTAKNRRLTVRARAGYFATSRGSDIP